MFRRKSAGMVNPEGSLPGRDGYAYPITEHHAVLGTPLTPPFPDGIETAVLAMGCFWGAERLYWRIPGVYTTAVGYSGGFTPYPTYDEVCSGSTGHAEAVLVAFDPTSVAYGSLLTTFFEEHDPTQGMRQGNDVGTQYRSAIYYTSDEQLAVAEMARGAYNEALRKAGLREVTTEVAEAGPFYYAEPEHQQYLYWIPSGYCGLKGTGVSCSLSSEADEAGLKALADGDDEWRRRLSPEEYAVLREAGTERAFTGKYVDVEEDGVYRCAACGNPLFDSRTKYHSGSGWPSFTDAISPEAVELAEDLSHGMARTEVRCARCHSHLGHLFDDGPPDAGGRRWCMNSISLELADR